MPARPLSESPAIASVSVVIPVLNDRDGLARLLGQLASLKPAGWEVLVVDGGSTDGSLDAAQRGGARLIGLHANRGGQLDHGFRESLGALIWFVHADTVISEAAIGRVEQVYRQRVLAGRSVWGRFDVHLVSARDSHLLGWVARLMNVRSRVTGICTGDQAIFVSRDLLESIGGVPTQPLMEDIELSKRLRAHVRPLPLAVRVGASARRWETRGVLRTVALMWWLRLRYFFGAAPEQLVQRYYG